MPTTIAPLGKSLTMPSPFEHPSLALPVTEEQRERSLAYLQQAYAEGRLTIYELDQRVETVLGATNRRAMNQAFTGLARIPVGTGASLLLRRPGNQPGPVSRVGATVAHLSGLGTSIVGPAVVYAMSPHGGYTRREAAKAFNFQLIALLVLGSTALLTNGWIWTSLLALPWLLLTVAGIAHAGGGDDWRNPVTRVLPLKLLDEGRPLGERPRELGR